MHDSTFQTVTEAQANTATFEIYADIKSTMGVALVNLVWRHLAVTPSVLEWSWQALKPHYTSGAIPAAAWILRESLSTPAITPFSTSEQHLLSGDLESMPIIDAVLRTYERGNAQNLVAMCHLRSLISEGNPVGNTVIPLSLDTTRQQAEYDDRVDITLPPLPDRSELNDDIWSHIEAMSEVWVPSEYRGLTPSVFRHIAHWPALLKLYRERLLTLQNNSEYTLPELTEQVIAHAQTQADGLGLSAREVPVPTAPDLAWLRGALDLFINGMISRGVVIVPAMRSVLSLDRR